MNGVRSNSTSSDDTVSHEAALWRRPAPVGYGIGLTSFATIAAPLLAGFSLTTIVTLSSSADNRGTRGGIAIAAFSVAAVLMLFTLQAGLTASQRSILPDQLTSQYPEARHNLLWMEQLRFNQWRDEKLAWRLYVRCRWTYNLGIITFIGGLVALLIPSPGKWDDLYTARTFPIVALVVAIIAILIELVLTFRVPSSVSDWLVPGWAASRPTKLRDVKDEPDDLGPGDVGLAEAQRLAFGDYGSFNSDVGNAASAFVAVTSALDSLATLLADFNQAVGKSVDVTRRQAEEVEDQVERGLLAAAAMRRANVEVTGPRDQGAGTNPGQPLTLGEQRWKVLNRGPAVARGVCLKLPTTTAGWEGQELHLLDREAGLQIEELGDLQVGKAMEVRVSRVTRKNIR